MWLVTWTIDGGCSNFLSSFKNYKIWQEYLFFTFLFLSFFFFAASYHCSFVIVFFFANCPQNSFYYPPHMSFHVLMIIWKHIIHLSPHTPTHKLCVYIFIHTSTLKYTWEVLWLFYKIMNLICTMLASFLAIQKLFQPWNDL